MVPDMPPATHVAYVQTTAYCLNSRTASGGHGFVGSVAADFVRLGKRIRVSRSPTGLKWHMVNDRTDGRTAIDFWVPSCARARAWGRQTVRVAY